MHARVPDGRDLDVVDPFAVDRVESEEREEEVCFDAFGSRAVRHDQPGVDPFERSLRNDDRHFLDAVVAHGFVVFQMQPRGLGIPAIFAASFAGPFGNSW